MNPKRIDPNEFHAARSYPLVLNANQTMRVDVVGDYVEIISADGAVRIETDTGYQVDANAGIGLEGTPFGRLFITDLSGAKNRVSVFAGGGRVVNHRVTGSVSVDAGNVGGSDQVKANKAFYQGFLLAPSSTLSGFQMLWNPAGSGINTIVQQYRYYVKLEAEIASGYVTGPTGILAGPRYSRLAAVGGAANSKTLYYLDRVAFASMPVFASGNIQDVDMGGGAMITRPMPYPVLLPPGTGWAWECYSYDTLFALSVDWTEETIAT